MLLDMSSFYDDQGKQKLGENKLISKTDFWYKKWVIFKHLLTKIYTFFTDVSVLTSLFQNSLKCIARSVHVQFYSIKRQSQFARHFSFENIIHMSYIGVHVNKKENYWQVMVIWKSLNNLINTLFIK